MKRRSLAAKFDRGRKGPFSPQKRVLRSASNTALLRGSRGGGGAIGLTSHASSEADALGDPPRHWTVRTTRKGSRCTVTYWEDCRWLGATFQGRWLTEENLGARLAAVQTGARRGRCA